MSKKIISILLAALMIMALSACRSKEPKSSAEEGYYVTGGYGYENNPTELGTPDKKLDPERIYQNLNYTAEMFYGKHILLGGEDAEKKYADEMDYIKVINKDEEYELTSIPFGIKAGKNTWRNYLHNVEDYDWAELSFYQIAKNNGEKYLYTLIGAYVIDGNTFIFKPLNKYNVDKENNKITYEFTETELKYEFTFSGRNLKLSNGDKSITLSSGVHHTDGKDKVYIYANNYLSPGSKAIDSIEHITYRYKQGDSDTNLDFAYASWGDTPDGHGGGIGRFEDNGLFTFTIPWETGTKTYQYVYFLCADDGIILTDGTDIYYYNDSYSDKYKNDINTFLTEDQTGKLDELTDAQLEAIVEKKENLMEDLAKAFNDAGIKVTVDEKSGELRMDSSVLFGGDSAVLTAEGKAFLNKFVSVYTSIVFSDKYDGFVSKTMVEGHTAPVAGSTYESGLPLSEERANNVKEYCISSETGVDTSRLSTNMEAIGYSNSKPVTDSNGSVDMSASRRVSFRFIINLDQK